MRKIIAGNKETGKTGSISKWIMAFVWPRLLSVYNLDKIAPNFVFINNSPKNLAFIFVLILLNSTVYFECTVGQLAFLNESKF